jgi:hypothetical protein
MPVRPYKSLSVGGAPTRLGQPAQSEDPSFIERMGGLRGLLGTGTRVISGVLSAGGLWPGAAISGAGESLAEAIEGSPQNPTRIAAEAALGSVPMLKIFKIGKPMQSFIRGAAYSGIGTAGRELAAGEDINPRAVAESAALGGATGAGLAKFLGMAGAKLDKVGIPVAKAGSTLQEVQPTAHVGGRVMDGKKLVPFIPPAPQRMSVTEPIIIPKKPANMTQRAEDTWNRKWGGAPKSTAPTATLGDRTAEEMTADISKLDIDPETGLWVAPPTTARTPLQGMLGWNKKQVAARAKEDRGYLTTAEEVLGGGAPTSSVAAFAKAIGVKPKVAPTPEVFPDIAKMADVNINPILPTVEEVTRARAARVAPPIVEKAAPAAPKAPDLMDEFTKWDKLDKGPYRAADGNVYWKAPGSQSDTLMPEAERLAWEAAQRGEAPVTAATRSAGPELAEGGYPKSWDEITVEGLERPVSWTSKVAAKDKWKYPNKYGPRPEGAAKETALRDFLTPEAAAVEPVIASTPTPQSGSWAQRANRKVRRVGKAAATVEGIAATPKLDPLGNVIPARTLEEERAFKEVQDVFQKARLEEQADIARMKAALGRDPTNELGLQRLSDKPAPGRLYREPEAPGPRQYREPEPFKNEPALAGKKLGVTTEGGVDELADALGVAKKTRKKPVVQEAADIMAAEDAAMAAPAVTSTLAEKMAARAADKATADSAYLQVLLKKLTDNGVPIEKIKAITSIDEARALAKEVDAAKNARSVVGSPRLVKPPIKPPEEGGGSIAGSGLGGLQNILSTAARHPEFASRVGLVGAGAVIGGMADPLDNPLLSAAMGAGFGLITPATVNALKNLGTPKEAIAAVTTPHPDAPQTIAEAAKRLFAHIPDIQRANYLSSGYGLPANVIAGPYGSAFMGSLEALLNGDPRGWRAIKLLGAKNFFKEFQASHRGAWDVVGRAEGHTMAEARSIGEQIAAWPGAMMTAGDMAARKILMSAGFTEAEARAITLTSHPEARFAKWAGESGKDPQGKTSGLLQFIFPFRRTPANIMEQGARRIPLLGEIVQMYRKNPDPGKLRAIQQIMGLGVGTGAGVLGSQLDPETAKIARRYVSNLGGQYSLPASIGFAMGQAVKQGQPMVSGAIRQAPYMMPLPTAEPITEWAKFGGQLATGSRDAAGELSIPRGAYPAFLRPEERKGFSNVFKLFGGSAAPKSRSLPTYRRRGQ